MSNGKNLSDEAISSEAPSLDQIFDRSIGQFGRWQFRISFLMSLLKFPIAWFQLGIVFLAPPTSFWCRRSPEYVNVSDTEWLAMVTPNMSHHRKQLSLVHGSCFMRDPFASDNEEQWVRCPWGYEFNTSVVHSSIITEWQLVCGRERLIDVAQVVFMFGVLVGTAILGHASDRFGRKPVLVVCLAVQALGGFVSALVYSYELFLVARFVTAIASGGIMVTSFVICMEVVGGKWRTIVPILYQIPFGLGNSILASLAYLLRDWRYLQLSLAILSSLYLFYIRLVPESPRWLLATGRRQAALHILEAAASENKKSMDELRSLLKRMPQRTDNAPAHRQPFLTGICAVPALRKRTLLLCAQWLIVGISFYGFSQYMGQVSSHLYLTVATAGLIAFPGTLLCCRVVQKYGRRKSIAVAHIYTAACYLAIMAVPLDVFAGDWPRVLLSGLGIIGVSVSMPALYLFTGELYPTVLRNGGVGASVMSSRVGSMVAPFVTSLSSITPWLPLLVLGYLVAVEALLVLPLPETKDIALPDTIQDATKINGSSEPPCR